MPQTDGFTNYINLTKWHYIVKSNTSFFNKKKINACRIYPKYSDTSTPYHTCSKIWTSTIYYPMLCLKIAGSMAKRVDPDEPPRSAAAHLGLHCLLRPVCPSMYGKYGRLRKCESHRLQSTPITRGRASENEHTQPEHTAEWLAKQLAPASSSETITNLDKTTHTRTKSKQDGTRQNSTARGLKLIQRTNNIRTHHLLSVPY